MGELGALFNPGMRHELEERRSKAARREEEGNARDGDLKIDLASGVAVINIPSEDDDPAVADGSSGSDDAASTTSVTVESVAQESAAQESDSDRTDDATSAAQSGKSGAEGAADNKPQPEALRPRGKRGLSSSSRR